MEDLNIKLLSALKSLMPFIDADIDRGIRNDNRHGGLEYRARNAKAVILEAEHTINAAEQAQQAEPVEVHGLGTPNVDVSVHDGKVVHYDNGPNLAEALARLASRVAKVRNLPAPTITAQPPAVAVPCAVDLLREMEWQHRPHDDHWHTPAGFYCPECQESQKVGHAADCKLAAVLAAAQKGGA